MVRLYGCMEWWAVFRVYWGLWCVPVSSLRQAFVQHAVFAAEHDDEVEPSLGEEVAAVVIDDDAARVAAQAVLLHVVQDLILVDDVRVMFLSLIHI